MQELFKKLSPIEIDDTLVEYYLSIGEQLVREYVNSETVDVAVVYQYQIVQVAVWLVSIDNQVKASSENANVQSLSSGGRSVSFRGLAELTSNDIPSHIKAQLRHFVKAW